MMHYSNTRTSISLDRNASVLHDVRLYNALEYLLKGILKPLRTIIRFGVLNWKIMSIFMQESGYACAQVDAF